MEYYEGKVQGVEESRRTTGGGYIITFRLRFNAVKKDDEWKSSFIDVVSFNELARGLTELKKGDPVIVKGKLTLEEWFNAAGEKKSKYVVRAVNVALSLKQDKIEKVEDVELDSDIPF